MDTLFIGYAIKLIAMLGLWGGGACMVYKNEVARPRHERIAEPHVLMILSAIWPLWLVGILCAVLAYGLVSCITHPFYFILRVRNLFLKPTKKKEIANARE